MRVRETSIPIIRVRVPLSCPYVCRRGNSFRDLACPSLEIHPEHDSLSRFRMHDNPEYINLTNNLPPHEFDLVFSPVRYSIYQPLDLPSLSLSLISPFLIVS